MPPAPVPLGLYDLRVPIGRGGMAVVWRAVYRPLAIPVAVKVLTPETAARADLVACFAREVRTAAALDHPNIAAILDAGEVTGEATAASGGRLVAGSPYLVTELALSSLAVTTPPSSWREVRRLITALLAALAYAHARGVTHRDLKPGNVLIGAPPQEQGGHPALPVEVGSLEGRQEARVMLSDFGLARTRGEVAVEDNTTSGTPAYMAPEQFLGDHQLIGPWTDLYALGCLTWWLVAGRTPFRPRTLEQAMLHHQHRALPPLRPLFPVPDGLEGWLFRMLARDPAVRFAMAADAAYGLALLGDAKPGAPVTPVEDGVSDADCTQPIAAVSDDVPLGWLSRPEAAAALCPRVPPPIRPLDGPGPARISPLIRGVGASLAALRPARLEDAEFEQATLWGALAAVHRDRVSRAVVAHGPAGARAALLGRWLAVRAHEVGAARWIRASFDRKDPRGGIAGLFRSHLGLEDVAPEGALARVESWLLAHGHSDPHAAVAVVALARSGLVGADGILLPERLAAARLVLRLAAEDRPLVLWLEGTGDASASIAALGALLSGRMSAPVLIALTVDDDAQWSEAARGALAALLRRGDVVDLPVGAPRPEALARAASA